MEILDDLAGLRTDAERRLDGAKFENAKLQRLLFGPGVPPRALVRLKDCSFVDCAVGGEFRIAPGVELENVLFEEVTSPDAMTINTQSVLNRVTVKGSRKCGGLWVKPGSFQDPERKRLCEEWANAASESIDVMLDFSEYLADGTEVIGLPLAKLKWNSDLHFPLTMRGRAPAEWDELELPPNSFWSMAVKRLQMFDAAEGVFALPKESHRKYAQAQAEMPRVVDAGFIAHT